MPCELSKLLLRNFFADIDVRHNLGSLGGTPFQIPEICNNIYELLLNDPEPFFTESAFAAFHSAKAMGKWRI
jgi:hypothetical protein